MDLLITGTNIATFSVKNQFIDLPAGSEGTPSVQAGIT